MNIKKISIKASAASLLAAALAVGVACGGGGGVSQEDFDALDARVTAVQTQLGGLQAVANQLTPELVTQLNGLVIRQQAALAAASAQEAASIAASAVAAGSNISELPERLQGFANEAIMNAQSAAQAAQRAATSAASATSVTDAIGFVSEATARAAAAATARAQVLAASRLANLGPPGGFLQRALEGEFEGSDPVTVVGPCRDACETDYNAILDAFEAATGIPAEYTGSAEFETEIQTRVAAGNPPDIADFPQPGAVQALAAEDEIINVADHISVDWLNEQYNEGWVGASTFEGPNGEEFVSGVWSRTNAKSYVWYSPKAFEAAGYAVPETWDELVDLTDQIRNDGATPWCVGIESGTATGWLATDWTEDILLRTTSLENYDRWTIPEDRDSRLLFDSPEVRRAITLWSDLWFGEDGNVRGGRETVVATDFTGGADPHLFSDPPGCYMLRQASFVAGGWIDDLGLEPGVDFDAFYFPPVDEQYGRPFLIGGDLNVAFNDRPEVLAVLEFHATPEFLTPFLARGGDLSPFRATREADYANEVQRITSELLNSSSAVRFDGSDLQPKEVGSGEFWSAITEFIAGSIDLDTAVERIDDAWPN